MITGFLPAFLPKAYMLAALTVCPISDAPKVIVHFGAEKTYYNETMASKDLTEEMRKDKDSTFATDHRWMVGGITTSSVDGGVRVSFKTMSDSSGNTCIYVETATFHIIYYPAIFIAKDHVGKKCYYQVVKAHEEQHVAIDIKSIQEYLPRIKMDMLLYLRSLGYMGFGPYTAAEAQKQSKVLTQQIMASSKPMLERLRDARRQRQGEIDTVENYMRESAKCPEDFKNTKAPE